MGHHQHGSSLLRVVLVPCLFEHACFACCTCSVQAALEVCTIDMTRGKGNREQGWEGGPRGMRMGQLLLPAVWCTRCAPGWSVQGSGCSQLLRCTAVLDASRPMHALLVLESVSLSLALALCCFSYPPLLPVSIHQSFRFLAPLFVRLV